MNKGLDREIRNVRSENKWVYLIQEELTMIMKVMAQAIDTIVQKELHF